MRPLVQPLWDYIQATRRKLRGKDVFVYELADSLKRFHLVDNVLVEANSKAVLDQLASMSAVTLRSTAVLEAADAGTVKRRQDLANGRIDLIGYRSDRIDLNVTVAGEAFLVIANTWSPYWVATVDGHKEALVRTNHTQYGLPIEPGAHKVKLAYCPPYALDLFL